MRQLPRRALAQFALTLFLTVAPVTGQDDGDTDSAADPPAQTAAVVVNVDVGTPIDFDLESGLFDAPLPFDVQFYLRTKIDENATRLSGRYVGDTYPILCEKAFPRVRLTANYGHGPRPLVASERRREVLIGSWEASPKRPNPASVLLNVNRPLLPNRYYCFEFTRVRRPEVDPEEFRRDLTENVDLALRGADDRVKDESLRGDDYRALRSAVIAAIENQLEPDERLVLPSTSFLDEVAQIRRLPAASKRAFDDVLEAQRDRATAIKGLNENAQFLAQLLEPLAFDADIGPLKLSSRRSADKKLAAVFKDKSESLLWAELAALSVDQRAAVLERIAQGTNDMVTAVADAIGADPPANAVRAPVFLDTWKPEDAAARKTNLERTRDQVNSLRGIVLELRAESLVEETGATSDLTALQTHLTAIRDGIDFLIEDVEHLEETLNERLQMVALLVADLDREEIERLRVEGSTLASYTVRANWYLGVDMGAAWSPDIEDFFAYVGTNIYFRPINKKAPLRWSDFRKGQRKSELFKRISVTIGIPINELTTPDDQFQSLPLERELQLVADRPVLFAAGLRLSDFFRVSAGSLVFKDRSPNPLVDRDELAWSPIVSLSIDWDAWATLQNNLRRRPP